MVYQSNHQIQKYHHNSVSTRGKIEYEKKLQVSGCMIPPLELPNSEAIATSRLGANGRPDVHCFGLDQLLAVSPYPELHRI